MADFQWTFEAEKQWNKRANAWSAKSTEMWESGSRKDIIGFFQNHIPKGASVCDLGCGDGSGSFKLAKEGYRVTGVDVSEEMIKKASRLTGDMDIDFQKGDISRLEFEDRSFDAVIAINSLEWVEHPLKCLMEIKRILANGGAACIGILGPTAMPRINSFARLYGEKVICNTMMPWEFERLAEELGWKKTDEMGVYKRGVEQLALGSLPVELKQSLSFMWVFLYKVEE